MRGILVSVRGADGDYYRSTCRRFANSSFLACQQCVIVRIGAVDRTRPAAAKFRAFGTTIGMMRSNLSLSCACPYSPLPDERLGLS